MTPFDSQKFENLNEQTMTSSLFETFSQNLYKNPESNWNEGRRLPILKIIDNYSKLYPDNVKFIRPEYKSGKYFTIIKFIIENDVYIYFEDISTSFFSRSPKINWFQLEKKDNSYPDNYLITKLILSSDNNAKTQGGAMLQLFEEYNSRK